MYARNYYTAVQTALDQARHTQQPQAVFWSNGTWNVRAVTDHLWALVTRVAYPDGTYVTN